VSLPPDIVEGKFEVLHKISEGGMGAVYKVRHILLDEPFVIKVIRPQLEGDENLRQRFHREAQAASRLRKHPNIAGIHDFSIGGDGTAYIVMEFIDGSTLKQILAGSGPPPLALTMEIAHQSLDALAFLHQQGYVHRDISPDNLMLTKTHDGKPLVKLIDLGLTKRLEASVELTTEGAFLGKARYSAPEQFNNRNLDARSDLYSFGVMLYELLTGRRPIEGEEFPSLVAGHLFHKPLDFDVADPEGRIPAELRRIVLKALEKEPDRRVASAEELSRSLEPFRHTDAIAPDDLERTIALSREPRVTVPVMPLPDGGTVVLTDAKPTRRWPIGVAAAAVAGLVAAGLWWLGRSPVIEVPPYQQRYQLALAAIEEKDWPAAGTHLDEAITLESREQARPQWASPDWDGPYLPHYYRGLVHSARFSCPLAMREWRESEDQGAIRETAYQADLVAKRADCSQEIEDTLPGIRSILEDMAGVAGVLRGALENPDLASVWRQEPDVETSIRAALELREDLLRQLEAFEGKRDYDSQDFEKTFQLEEDASRLKQELERLSAEISEES
jgi:tRNA A-37 threonylcarbamoyl transferase component Bud32